MKTNTLRYRGHVVLCLHSKKGEWDCDKFVQPLFLQGDTFYRKCEKKCVQE